jgi:F-type H+-transporting ATPase subunit b
MAVDGWTLGIQFLNVVILVWLLAHFFWRPVADAIEGRRRAVEESLEEVAEARTQVEAERVDITRTRSGFDAERERIMAEARDAGRAEAAEIVTSARKEAVAMREAAKAGAARDREAAEDAWRETASELAVEIAANLLALLDPRVTLDAFLEAAMGELRALPDRVRTPMPGTSARLRVTTAGTLSPEERDTCLGRLGDALGPDWAVDFEVDPDLLGGVEVEGPAFRVRNSWRAALEHAGRQLHDDRPT